MGSPAAPASRNTNTERKRLHISPFTEDLLDRYVPTAIRPLASDISFHTVQTAPERPFGYVELPVMEADKLRKKLNGMTMKGAKIKIEEAKPEKKRKVEAESEDEDDRKARKKAKKERRKKEEGVIPGYELEGGRHVKRGWKEDGADKKANKGKKPKPGKEGDAESLKGKKMLFKTVVPPNVAPLEKKKKAKSDAKKEAKEEKAVEAKHGKEKRKAVVQEFAKTQKSVISANGLPTGKGAARYEDGKGWVDEAGEVVEAERPSKKPRRSKRAASPENDASSAEESSILDDSSVVSDDESSAEDIAHGSLDNGYSGSSQMEEITVSAPPPVDSTDDEVEAVEANPASAEDDSDERSNNDIEDTAHATPEPHQIHPLEALFKRSAPNPESATKIKPQAIDTSFGFFNSGAADEDEDENARQPSYPPQTPHTKADFEWRGQRSAAPTPDTAAIGRKFSFPFAQGREGEDDEDDEDEDEMETAAGAGLVDGELPDANRVPVGGSGEAQVEESEFRKWFYDNRGSLNRGWKKRRREEKKAKRQRENRRLSRRVV
ncbi:hypothetical protein LTR08_007731 [Meristemomyces frigidus]|nr:hypothetical protein LTR08_007731 [Meristemomyces frigidus]